MWIKNKNKNEKNKLATNEIICIDEYSTRKQRIDNLFIFFFLSKRTLLNLWAVRLSVFVGDFVCIVRGLF